MGATSCPRLKRTDSSWWVVQRASGQEVDPTTFSPTLTQSDLTLNQRWASEQEEEVSPPSEVGLQGPESLRLWNEEEKKKNQRFVRFCSRRDERLCVVTTAAYQEFIKRCVHWHAVRSRNNRHSSFSTSSLSSHDGCLFPFSFSFSSLTGSDGGKRETVLLPESDKSLPLTVC